MKINNKITEVNKINIYKFLIIFVACILFVGCEDVQNTNNDNTNLEFTYNFNDSSEGFIINKTDVPLDYNDKDYEFSYELEEIPIEGNKTKALAVEYNNKNKDMFVYVFKEIGEGNSVEASTTYNATLRFDVGTNISDTTAGEKTHVKAGVVSRLPLPEEKSDRIDFNLDKGNNEKEGVDLKTLEGITKPNKDNQNYEFKSYTTSNQVIANKNGMIYAVVGVDSTYDEKIKFYIDNVNLKLEKVKEQVEDSQETND